MPALTHLPTAALEAVPCAVFITEPDGAIVWANAAFTRLNGYAAEESIGRNPRFLASGRHPRSFYEEMWKTVVAGEVWHGEIINRRKDGSLCTQEMTITPLADERGKVSHFIVIQQNVSGSKVEEARAGSEPDYRVLFESVNDAMVICEPDNQVILEANHKACEMYGIPKQELLGTSLKKLTEDTGQCERQIAQLLQEGTCGNCETVHLTRDGRRLEVLVSSSLIDYHGRRAVLSVNRDITELKRAERALRESEDRYRDLVEHSQDLLCTHNLEGRLLSANPAPARVLGYEVEELLQIPLRELLVPEFRDQCDEYLARIQRDGEAKGLLAVLTRTGERRIWEYHNTLRTEGVASPIVRGMAHDVTERVQAEQALRKSEERLRVALKNSPIIVFNQDRDLRYTGIHNPSLAWAERDYLGKTDEEILSAEDAARLTVIKRRVLESGSATREEVFVTHQGKKHYFDLTVEPLRDSGGAVVGITCAGMEITELREKSERLQMLLELNHALVSKLDLQELFSAISSCIRRVVQQDYASVAMPDPEGRAMRIYALAFPLAKTPIRLDTTVPIKESLAAQAFLEREVKLFRRSELAAMGSSRVGRMLEAGIQSICCIPLATPKGPVGTLNLGSTREDAFSSAEIELMQEVATQVAIALDNARAYREIGQLKDKLAGEKLYLEDEIRSEHHFEEIIGESPALKRALAKAKTVAASDATVLILGETGTGKELVARAIHRLSKRRHSSFIKLNCAAIPTGLLESELFGHEKGAFTGAISQKVGRLELADKGTLFLDEIGDIPLELQPKLLRVLQDQEFERLGSNRTIRVEVRLVAATNRDLAKSVAERRFREDLYYRLNVFPICLAPLRERREDISPLARHFVKKYADRMDKRIQTIPNLTIDALMKWDWPGNVRELENFMERSVILTQGPVLMAPLTELRPEYERSQDRTLEAAERKHIIRTLRETNGIIAGPNGAAARLGVKRTTLQSKIRRLGISRENYGREVPPGSASS